MSAETPTLYIAEPSAIYLARPPLVVDCSVLSAAIFDESTRDQAIALLSGKQLFAPYLLDCEIASVALKKDRLGWSAASISLALADYIAHDIERHGTDPQAQYAIAQRYKLSAYDAAYLWLAAELKAPLATFDEKLATAAKAHLASLA